MLLNLVSILWGEAHLILPNNPSTFYGLGSPLLEILFPISPNQLVKLTWSDTEGYIFVDSQPTLVDEINRLMVLCAEKQVILNNNKPNPYWFEAVTE
jgi:hypothetical protein